MQRAVKSRHLPRRRPQRPRGAIKHSLILSAAMRHFARQGFHQARVADIAAELGIAKGSIFQHFGSKDGLFLEAYKQAAHSLPAYTDAPSDVLAKGFFATLRYWLERTDHLLREDWVPCRVVLIGNYGAGLRLKQEINRFLTAEDPYGTVTFVKLGIERGEVRRDIDLHLVVSIVDWMMERFQDALIAEELDPGLFHRPGATPESREARMGQFLEVLRGAIGSHTAAPAADTAPGR
jgi:AcrR family transcriptional regulator